MLPTETEFKRTGNLGGEEVTMTFDENSLGFLSSVLINLYSDKELACIREYSTNALDSHKAAGQSRPIEVTTPTGLSYFLRVKDWGVGLSADDIRNMYSKYGASSKRETNEQTGMLGLGSKSALTYTNQFNIMSVKDGMKINVAVSRADDGGGVMEILSEIPTDEPNGVEIIIPVDRMNTFASKARSFFQYWPEGTVLLNGREVERQPLLKVSDRISLVESPTYYEKSYVVMGGVSYTIDPDQMRFPKGFIAFVEIGEVNFTPNREQLHYTKHTKNTLESLLEEYKREIFPSIQKEMNDAEDVFEVSSIFFKWKNTLKDFGITIVQSDFTYKGKELQVQFDFDARWSNQGSVLYAKPGAMRNYAISGVELNKLKDVFIAVDFDSDKITPWQKKKLQHWLDNKGRSGAVVYFCKDKPDNGWLDDISTLSWTNDILPIKITRTGGKTKGKNPTYECYLNGSITFEEELDKTKPIWYSTKTQWEELTGHINSRGSFFQDVQFAFVGKNRINKFLKLYPKAIKLRDALTDKITVYWASLTTEHKNFITSDDYKRSRFANLPEGMLDPELVKLLELSGRNDEIHRVRRNWEIMCGIAAGLGNWNFRTQLQRSSHDEYEWVDRRYPLLKTLIGNRNNYGINQARYDEHVLFYLNGIYQQMIEE